MGIDRIELGIRGNENAEGGAATHGQHPILHHRLGLRKSRLMHVWSMWQYSNNSASAHMAGW